MAKISPVKAADVFYGDAAVETTEGNPSTETNPIDDSEAPAEIIPEDVLLQYFGSVDIAPSPSSPVGIHRERVEETLSKGISTSKKEFHALRTSLFRLSKEAKDSPVLATAYNDMALALSDLFTLHKTAKDSHDEAPLDYPLNSLANYEEVVPVFTPCVRVANIFRSQSHANIGRRSSASNVALAQKLFAEAIGAYVIIFAWCGSVAVYKLVDDESITLSGISMTWGAVVMVMVMVYSMAQVSGAHFNPAVTLIFTIFRRFPLKLFAAMPTSPTLYLKESQKRHSSMFIQDKNAKKYGKK
ncbi:hypothetical protein RND71_034265 [Anisodus tanguticus]|uniref:Uncharacterized protein n=1 Tax=Anisodus tanguticus TaxID=243964 RepID=A0AAE1R9T6_9SOLA|nr:hypothetical protein RND71_034265 [Anisodus tanguticus]